MVAGAAALTLALAAAVPGAAGTADEAAECAGAAPTLEARSHDPPSSSTTANGTSDA
jgi:hypothetical protein